LSIRVPIHPEVEIDSYAQIKRLVSRGLGYGILPRMAVHKEAEAGVFRIWQIERPEITRKVYLAYSTERPLPHAPACGRPAGLGYPAPARSRRTWTAELSDESQRPAFYD
jgi:LysR family nitrogen assimilation transcriptional regulator